MAGETELEIYWGSAEERDLSLELAGPGVKVMPVLDLPGFMRAAAGLRAFISPDTGPMHVVSALGVSVIALFRTDNVARFSPLSAGSKVLFDPEGASPQVVADSVKAVLAD